MGQDRLRNIVPAPVLVLLLVLVLVLVLVLEFFAANRCRWCCGWHSSTSTGWAVLLRGVFLNREWIRIVEGVMYAE